jgi:thymidine phosphorylase
MLIQEILRRKRDGQTLTDAEIEAVVRAIVDGGMDDAQVGAFAMAVCCRGMSAAETVTLTCAMRDSGRVLDWSDLPGPTADKHSTGGIGDKVSLILAPLLAACGLFVPMLSGRGLGHTGGTLDKLEAIPGYRTRVDAASLRRVVADAGCAIVGAGEDLAPADRRLYAIRDVTGTVESIPLITASILSKKLAAGPRALVLDVKTGSGAFMAALDDARALARSLVTVARGAGLATTALLTDMDQCLGRTAGNALEVAEALAWLRGETPEPRLTGVTLALGSEALRLAGVEPDPGSATARLERAWRSGGAAERLARMVGLLGGPSDLLEHPDRHLPLAPVVRPCAPIRPGVVTAVDARALGLAIVELGGGRRHPGDRIDPAVGLAAVATIGEAVGAERPLAVVHARDAEAAEGACRQLRHAFTVDGPTGPAPAPVVERID